MKTKIKSIYILFLCLSTFTKSTIISEGYHFFDVFYYRDMYKSFIKQNKINKCSIGDGPNCVFIQSKSKNEISKDLKNIYPDSEEFFQETPENILLKLKEKTKLISTKEKEKLDEEIFSFDSPYVMSLYLTFESYDEKTKEGDIYAPETIDTPYDVGRMTLNVFGKLRLSQKNIEKFEDPTPKSLKQEGPKGTYAFVESKEVFINFNSKSSIVSLYIRKNSYNKNNKTFYLYGYKDGNKHIITKVQNVPSNRWIKINGDEKKYDSIGLIRGFDYDNLVINTPVNLEKTFDVNKYQKKYSSFLNEKINVILQDTLNQLKNEGIQSENDEPGIKVIKIDLNQNNFFQEEPEEQEENFEIPEEIMNEINKNENIFNDKNKPIDDNKKNQNINKEDL
jgi:hypothetical protein